MRRIAFASRPLALAAVLAVAACEIPFNPEVAGPDDPAPAIEILNPLRPFQGTRLLAGRVRVTARCADEPAPCLSLEAFIGTTRVARGTDSIDAVVSLADVQGDSVSIRLVATSPDAVRTVEETPMFEVEPSPRWVELYTVPAPLVDADPGRAIFRRGDELVLRYPAAGRDSSIYFETNVRYADARLFPGGFLVLYPRVSGTFKRRGVEETGGSNARHENVEGAIAARGRWAMWASSDFIARDDVLAPQLTFSNPPVPEPMRSWDLAEDGTVVFLGYVGTPEDPFTNPQLLRLRDGPDEQLTFDTTTVPLMPETDGTNIVYTRRAVVAGDSTYELVLLTPAGEEILAGPRAASRPPYSYVAEAGWIVYTIPGDGPWARSPSGARQRVTSPNGASITGFILGPAGQVVMYAGRRMLVGASVDAPLVDVGGSHSGQEKWIDGQLYSMTSTAFFRIDL